MVDDDRWGWLRAAAGAVDGSPEEVAGRVVAGVAVAVAASRRVRLPDLALLSAWGSPATVTLPPMVPADAWLVGTSLEVLVDAGERRRRGAHHTPRLVAEVVTGMAFDGVAVDRSTTVCDPAVGGGAFLLAAGEVLAGAGVSRAVAVRQLHGVDVDPLSVAATEAALHLWAEGRTGSRIEVGDALGRPVEAWGEPTVVVGNPPFLGQLRTATSRPPPDTALRADLAELAGPYTDTAALFAALATSVVAPGGRVALVLPRSFLVARDARRVRDATLASATLDRVWWPGQRVFVADVDVCVPVWRRRLAERPSPPRSVTRSSGCPPVSVPAVTAPRSGEASWSRLLLGLDGADDVPSVDAWQTAGALADHAVVNAGFRDQYYGLIPYVVDDTNGVLDDAAFAPLVTSGLIDPATCRWGERSFRYAGRRWTAARVDVAAVEAAGGWLARWVAGKRVPKLLVAAQTRVVEAVADVDGTWLPSTPVATVAPEPGWSWRLLAVLLSPAATAWAVRHHSGSGLASGSFRLPPAALRVIPLPADDGLWDAAADDVQAAQGSAPEQRRALLASAARSMCAAYGLDPDVPTAWWLARLPPP